MSRKLTERNAAEIPADLLCVSDVLVDNDATRITRHHIRPGQHTGWHVHEYAYAGIHESASDVRVEDADGSVESVHSEAGWHLNEPAEHDVTNVGATDMMVYEVEFKRS
jgi:quercetin dioxygenase-like cupin family protein